MNSYLPLAALLLALLCLSSQQLIAEPTGHSIPARKDYTTNDTMRTETRYVVELLERMHYMNKAISKIDFTRFLRSYINNLDSSHLFMLEPEIKQFEDRFAPQFEVYLRQGNLFPAFEIFYKSQKNINKRVDWIEKRLQHPFNFREIDIYRPDRRELPWPATEQEADRLWEDRLKYEIINEVLSLTAEDREDFVKALQKNLQQTPPSHLFFIQEPSGTHKIDWLFDRLEHTLQQPRLSVSGPTIRDHKTTRLINQMITLSLQPSNRFVLALLELESHLGEAIANVKKRYQRLRKMINELKSTEVQEIYLTSLTNMYDPHSTFLSADTLEEFSIAISNSLIGIGAVLADEEGYCTIKELLPGGPAEKSGKIYPNDKIVGVGQGHHGSMVDVVGMRLQEVAKLLRGAEGSIVRLLLRPTDADPAARKTIVLKRAEIKLTENLASAKLIKVPSEAGDRLIGVIELPTFYGSDDADGTSTTDDVAELIDKLKKAGMQGLVLDLRRNGGGLFFEAIDLTGLFIPQGPVLQVRDTLGQISEYQDNDPRIVWEGPLIVLVSRYSASASEITAGALKSHRRALIVGDSATHGKGSVQVVFEIGRSLYSRLFRPKMGAAKMTIQKWYLPDGKSTQLRGVAADIALPSINSYLPIGEEDLTNPMPWDSIQPLQYKQQKAKGWVCPEMIDFLATQSKHRQEQLAEFDYLNYGIHWLKKKQDQKTFSLHLPTRHKQHMQDDAYKKSMEERMNALIEQQFEAENILLAATTTNLSAQDKKQPPKALDIHMRESLRIMSDWITLENLGEKTNPVLEHPMSQYSVRPSEQ